MRTFRAITWTLASALVQPLQCGEAPAGSIAVPVRVNLGPMLQKLEQTTPKIPPGVETWTDLPNLANGRAAYRFNIYRDPMVIRLVNNRVLVRTEAHYWLEVGMKVGGAVKGVASCGLGNEQFRRVYLGANAEVGLTPAWGLDVKVQTIQPEAMTPCEVTMLGVDITPKVLKGMSDSLSKAASSLEQMLRDSTFLRQRAELVWDKLQKPLEVAPGIYLSLNPERIQLGAWTSQGRVLTIPLGIQARPAIHFGVLPEEQKRPLPPLETNSQMAQSGFRIQVDSDIEFAQATEQLRRQLRGKRFTTEKGNFDVLDVAVRGEDGKALIELTLGGKVNGKLTLAGRLHFDERTGALSLQEMDYTLESKSWITKTGEWLFRSNIRKTLDEKANWMVNRSFKDLRELVQRGLNRKLAEGMAMSGTLDSMKLGQPKVLADRFRVEATLEGALLVASDGAM